MSGVIKTIEDLNEKVSDMEWEWTKDFTNLAARLNVSEIAIKNLTHQLRKIPANSQKIREMQIRIAKLEGHRHD